MPELPDVEGFKHYLEQTALGQRIERVRVTDARIVRDATPDQLIDGLESKQLNTARRHGKYLFADLDTGGALVLHFGMTGELSYYPSDAERPRYARVILTLTGGHELAYINRRMLGRVTLADSTDAFIKQHNLGPDALDTSLDANQFIQRVRDRRGTLKSVLMNQENVAGIGNVWADEILFQARLHPEARLDSLDEKQLRSLHRIMQRVLETGARHGGDPQKLPQRYLLRHRGEGACPECGGEIKKITVSGRSTYFCPRCQTR